MWLSFSSIIQSADSHLSCLSSWVQKWTKKTASVSLRPPLWSSGQSYWLHNGDVSCFLWGTNWIYICYVEERRPHLWSSGQSFWLHNGAVLFSVRYELNYICYVEERRSSLWSSGLSFWLQILRSGFVSWRYHIFWEVVGLERGPLSLVNTIEELLGRKK
jgi:hypothetical protein